jgi:predicted Zn-ribbon and HTH transcriptional regulator
MSRPPLEVADLIRTAGTAFLERNRHWLSWKHVKVLRAIARCRTAALGGHLDECTRCGYRAISYNSCRNRHCPKCQTAARERWIAARRRELLPTRYVHVVFTLPRELAPLALQNKKFIYDLLFRASAETLLEVARDSKHLGAEIGFFSVLHTWNQKLGLHPHVHCVVPAGGLSLDHTRWIINITNVLGVSAPPRPFVSSRAINLFFSLLTLIHYQPTCLVNNDFSFHALSSAPLRSSGPPPHHASNPFNPHRARVRRNHGRLRSNGFIEGAPEHCAHAHSFPESAPPIKH